MRRIRGRLPESFFSAGGFRSLRFPRMVLYFSYSFYLLAIWLAVYLSVVSLGPLVAAMWICWDCLRARCVPRSCLEARLLRLPQEGCVPFFVRPFPFGCPSASVGRHTLVPGIVRFVVFCRIISFLFLWRFVVVCIVI